MLQRLDTAARNHPRQIGQPDPPQVTRLFIKSQLPRARWPDEIVPQLSGLTERGPQLPRPAVRSPARIVPQTAGRAQPPRLIRRQFLGPARNQPQPALGSQARVDLVSGVGPWVEFGRKDPRHQATVSKPPGPFPRVARRTVDRSPQHRGQALDRHRQVPLGIFEPPHRRLPFEGRRVACGVGPQGETPRLCQHWLERTPRRDQAQLDSREPRVGPARRSSAQRGLRFPERQPPRFQVLPQFFWPIRHGPAPVSTAHRVPTRAQATGEAPRFGPRVTRCFHIQPSPGSRRCGLFQRLAQPVHQANSRDGSGWESNPPDTWAGVTPGLKPVAVTRSTYTSLKLHSRVPCHRGNRPPPGSGVRLPRWPGV